MEDLGTQERIISLGKHLAEELERGEHPDTLSRWMSHYIAQLIVQIENNTNIKKKTTEKECFNTILKLWEYKSSFPNGKKPFERFDVIYDTLERLNPNNRNAFFYKAQPENEESTDDTIKQLMKVAQAIDEAARVWLEEIYKSAIEYANDDKTKKWLSIAMPAKRRNEINLYLKIKGSNENDDLKSRIKEQIEYLESRIEQLKAFRNYNEGIQTRFTEQITLLKGMLKKQKSVKNNKDKIKL